LKVLSEDRCAACPIPTGSEKGANIAQIEMTRAVFGGTTRDFFGSLDTPSPEMSGLH